MKRVLLGVGSLLLLAPLVAGPPANLVTHIGRDGEDDTKTMSRGACRHHLTAHVGDYVATTTGPSSDPSACN